MRARHRLGEDRSQFAQDLEVGYALVVHFLDDGLDDAGREQLLADPVISRAQVMAALWGDLDYAIGNAPNLQK